MLTPNWKENLRQSRKNHSGISVMTVADLPQLPSFRYLLGLRLWHLFKYSELTEVVKQNDKLFIGFLEKSLS